jgi:hypothetical protein
MQQVVPQSRNVRPLKTQLGAAWNAVRDRLASFEALPAGNADRKRATSIHDMLFPDGLEFLKLAFAREHAESGRRIRLLDEHGLAKDLERLIGVWFVAELRATQEAYGDALGINEGSPLPAAPVFIVEPLRVLADAISGYALQMLALARHDPQRREALLAALAPIEEFRASAGRRISAADEEDVEDVDVDVDTPAVIVTPQPTTTPVVLAPVA